MLRRITKFSRLAVGILFIFSGLIKLNDPMGFGYKLQEYFAENVLNLPGLTRYALLTAILLIITEIELGVLLLLGYKKRLTLWALTFLTLFFSLLTFYSAYFHKVTDCGCFGDAIPLTPWQSFGKNVVLMLLIGILWIGRRHIRPQLDAMLSSWVAFVSFTGSLFIGYLILTFLPPFDFRPYAVGTNIEQSMTFPEGAARDVYEQTWIYRVNGVEKTFKTSDKPWNIEGAEFVDRKTKLVKKGYTPPIHDLSAERGGVDHLKDFLSRPKMLWIVIYDIQRANRKGVKKVRALAKRLSDDGISVAVFTASSQQEIQDMKVRFSLPFDFYICDETTLKTMVRANPGLVLLERGTIIAKWNWENIPNIRRILARFDS